MAKLVHATRETHDLNHDAAALTLYFDGTPTDAEVARALERCQGLCLADEGPGSQVTEVPTPVSRLAGVRRYQVYP